jgi:hypothetical protein
MPVVRVMLLWTPQLAIGPGLQPEHLSLDGRLYQSLPLVVDVVAFSPPLPGWIREAKADLDSLGHYVAQPRVPPLGHQPCSTGNHQHPNGFLRGLATLLPH